MPTNSYDPPPIHFTLGGDSRISVVTRLGFQNGCNHRFLQPIRMLDAKTWVLHEKCKYKIDTLKFCHEQLAKKHRIIFGDTISVFNCVHIFTQGKMNAFCWLHENDIINTIFKKCKEPESGNIVQTILTPTPLFFQLYHGKNKFIFN